MGKRAAVLYRTFAYNTAKVAKPDAPKTYADLLDPKWKGRLAISGSDTTPVNWVGAMVLSEGEDFVRRLGQQSIRVYSVSARAVTNLMISGEVELSPTVYLAHAESSRKAGASLQWAALGPVPVLWIRRQRSPQKAPHPHAAKCCSSIFCSRSKVSCCIAVLAIHHRARICRRPICR